MHPAAEKKYKQADFQLALESASDQNEATFFEKAKLAKQAVTREITAIYRLKKAQQEYFYYGEELRSKDNLGNMIDHYRTVGLYKDPSFRYQLNQDGNKVATEIQNLETVYEYKWPDDWTTELESLVSENVSLTVITPSRKYGGFTLDDFIHRSFDELLVFGKFGTYNPVVISELNKAKAAVGKKL